MSLFKKFAFAVAFVLLSLAFVGVVSAAGPYTRWVQLGTTVYDGPDTVANVLRTVTATVSISVTLEGGGWARIWDIEEYVPTTSLLKEEPTQVKTAREQAVQKATEEAKLQRKVSDMSLGELLAYLRQLLSGSTAQPVVASTPLVVTASAPAVPAPAATGRVHIVVSGESLSGIAAKYGVSNWQDIARANGVVGSTIVVGQRLIIPDGTVATTAAPATSTVNPPTSFGPRDCLVVNGVKTSLEGQDVKDVRAMYHDETGIAKGQPYTVVVPQGWSLGIFGVSAEVVAEGGKPVQYTGGPALIIRGPWKGQIGAYEAGLHGVPVEWEDFLATTIFASHRKYVPAAKLTYIP